MNDWRQVLGKVAVGAEAQFDTLKAQLDERLGVNRPINIQPYHWFGTQSSLTVRGRVLRYNGLRGAQDNDTLWDNLVNAYRRLNSDEIAYAKVRASYRIAMQEAACDDEGYFWVELPISPLGDGAPPWQSVLVELTAPHSDQPIQTMAEVLVPPISAEYGIISDIDDTVLQTKATNYLEAARLTFTGNAKSRLPFEGVADYYQALQAGRGFNIFNPIFYVSSSPWNLYDLLIDFLELQNIPKGPLCLRDIGIDEDKLLSSSHEDHKTKQITRILDTYADLPFVLIGDSGQHDPEIYEKIVHQYPGRIKAVYIRDVTQHERDVEVEEIAKQVQAEGVPMLLVQHTDEARVHSAEIGLI